MLSNGAHYRITSGGVNYDFLAELAEGPRQQWQSLIANRQVGAGLPGRQNIDPELLFYVFEDWSGGENNKFYNPADPVVYDYATAGHGRVPKVLKGTPTKSGPTSAVTLAADPVNAWLTNAVDKLWATGTAGNGTTNNDSSYSSNGTSWTPLSAGPGANVKFTAACGDSAWLQVAMMDNVSHERWVRRYDTAGSGGNSTAVQATASDIPFVAIALAGPWLYAAGRGGNVYRADVSGAAGAAWSTVIYNLGYDIGDTGSAGAVTTDTSVLIFVSRTGFTQVHEITAPQGANPVGRLIWGPHGLIGFTCTAIGYASGIIYLAGYYGDGTTNRAFLWGMSNTDRVPVPIGYFRSFTSSTSNLIPRAIAAGEGAQVLIGMQSGEVFVYDQELDAISLLDTQTGEGNLSAVGHYAGKRVAAFKNTTTDIVRTSSWNDDASSTTSGATVILPAWDFDLTEVTKELDGTHTTFQKMTASESIIIDYQVDESGTWVPLTTINLANYPTEAALGRVDQLVAAGASTVKFRQIRFRITTTNGAQVYSLSAQAQVITQRRSWVLPLMVSDEAQSPRPTDKQRNASEILDVFTNTSTGLIPNRNVVTFVDGSMSPDVSSQSFVARITGGTWLPKELPEVPDPQGLKGTLFLELREVSVA